MEKRYCLHLFVVALVAGSLATSKGIRAGIISNGSPTFSVLHYGAKGDGKQDDSEAFGKAWNDVCGASGDTSTLIVPGDKTFFLKPVSFRGPCKSTSVHVEIQGSLVAADTIAGWGGSCPDNTWVSFASVDNLIIDGQGEFDGKGSAWWGKSNTTIDHVDSHAIDNAGAEACDRPSIIRFSSCKGMLLRGISTKDSPGAHVKINGCDNSTISNIHITAPKDTPNTDGIDISSTTHLQILDSVIATGDDCIAIGSDTSYFNISGITCGPGHGISVGSLGLDGAEARVEEIHVRNCTFINASNGARIKTWQGGAGYARNITFDNIPLIDVQNPIIVDQFYCPAHNCPFLPKAGAVALSGLRFSSFHGTSASVAAITLNCSQAQPCSDVVLDDINITPSTPIQQVQALCENVKGSENAVKPNIPCLS